MRQPVEFGINYNNRNIEIVCSSVDGDNMVQLTVSIVCRSDVHVTDGVWTVDQYLRSEKCFDMNLRIERKELSIDYQSISGLCSYITHSYV